MYRIFDGIEDVTYSPEDWEDFWYNSATNSMTIHSTKDRKSFDELYEEYSSMSIPEQLNNLKQLGRDFVNKLDAIIDQLDTILEEDSTK